MKRPGPLLSQSWLRLVLVFLMVAFHKEAASGLLPSAAATAST